MRSHTLTDAPFAQLVPGQQSAALLEGLRADLAIALERGAIDDVVVTSLQLARILVDDHAMTAAIVELQATIVALTAGPIAVPPLWRLLLTLAALYQAAGNAPRARQAAVAAYHHASLHHSEPGRTRAASLLARLVHAHPHR